MDKYVRQNQSELSSRGDNISYFSEKKLIVFWRQKAVLIALFGATSGWSDPVFRSDLPTLWKLSFVLKIHNRETSKKENFLKSFNLWTKQNSVNNEENKDNDENINKNNVESEQLDTQLQNNNGVTLKISESTTCANSQNNHNNLNLPQKQLQTQNKKELSNLLLTRVRALFLLVDCAYPIALMEVLLK